MQSLRLLIAIVLVKRDFYLLVCKIFAKSYADSFLERENGRVGQDIWKGVYYALVLTFWNFATFKCLSKTKQRGCPVGVLYTYPKYRIAIGVSIPHGNYWYRGCVIHIGVGLMRCSFRQTGAMRRPLNREASDSAGLHAFLCLEVIIIVVILQL